MSPITYLFLLIFYCTSYSINFVNGASLIHDDMFIRGEEQSEGPGRSKRDQPKVASKSEEMCNKYAESVFVWRDSVLPLLNAPKIKEDQCGITAQTLIVGGEKAKPKEFPHMAIIGYGEDPLIHWLCGGSLISDRWILSAAHCLESKDQGPAKWTVLGDLKVLDESDDAEPKRFQIEQRIVHPNYNKNKVYNDIALFKLNEDVEFSGYIRPICLQVNRAISSKSALASGWGRTMWKGSPTKDLMKVTLNLTDTAGCNTQYMKSSSVQRMPQGIDSTSMICAGTQKGKDTCQGDSGGPLQVTLKEPYCMYSQIGITSFGAACGSGVPGVYTRVSHFVPWIESIVWP